MAQQKTEGTAGQGPFVNQKSTAKMPRYTYYLSNYQYVCPSVNCAFSNEEEKSHPISPRFGLDGNGEEQENNAKCDTERVALVSNGVEEPSSTGVTFLDNHVIEKENEQLSKHAGKEVNEHGPVHSVPRARFACMDPDDELCSASVVEYSGAYTDPMTSGEYIRESGGNVSIDQPFAATMKRWGATYAYGNMEEFRRKQKERMQELGRGSPSKDSLDEFPIRCVFVKGETVSDGKFDPLYIKGGDILVNRYHVLEVLGNTPFSVVLKVRDEKTGEHECIKISMPETVSQAIDEINLLKILNRADTTGSNAIVQLKDYFYFRGCVFTILELLGPNLYEATRELYKKRKRNLVPVSNNDAVTPLEQEETKGWSLDTIRRIAMDILGSLRYMHSMGIINCDLKPENIVLNNDVKSPMVKLIDFGSSCYIQEQLSNYVQSRSYRAPEVILGLPYDTQIDLWSLGCLLCEIYMQRILFPSDNNATLMASMISLLGVPPVYILQHKMNSTFMVLPNGNVADLTIMTDTLKGSQKNFPSDYQSSIRCNMSFTDSSCCSRVANQALAKTDVNNGAEYDSVIDMNDVQDAQPDSAPQDFTNITPRKYSIMGGSAIGNNDANRFRASGKGIKLDIGHGPSKSKSVRIIEPTRCSIDEMLDSSSSSDMAVFADFIKGLLQYDPLERLTAATALTHSFITQK